MGTASLAPASVAAESSTVVAPVVPTRSTGTSLTVVTSTLPVDPIDAPPSSTQAAPVAKRFGTAPVAPIRP